MAALTIAGLRVQNAMVGIFSPYQFLNHVAISLEEDILSPPVLNEYYTLNYTISNLTSGSVGVSMFLYGSPIFKYDELKTTNGTFTLTKQYTGTNSLCFNEQTPSPLTIITVNSIESYTPPPPVNSFELFDNCCDNQTNIVWLNQQGGYQNYIFTGIKTYQVRGGDAKTFKSNGITKYYQRENVYEGKIVTTSNIQASHVDYLDSLRYCIQAWEWNTDDDTFREILIDVEDFDKYKTRQKLHDVAIRFIYTDSIVIQTQ